MYLCVEIYITCSDQHYIKGYTLHVYTLHDCMDLLYIFKKKCISPVQGACILLTFGYNDNKS